MQRNHQQWKDEAVGHTQQLETELEASRSEARATAEECARLAAALEQVRSDLVSARDESVSAVGAADAEVILLRSEVEVCCTDPKLCRRLVTLII